jgi:hypothetical protein
LANTKLAEGATQFIVTEAKLFSPLSSRVTNAAYFDQAAKNVACIAEVLCRATRKPEEFASLGFFVIAPDEQIRRHLFETFISKPSIQNKVLRRVEEYPTDDRLKKMDWY